MRRIECKRCSKEYEGDPVGAWVCTPCRKILLKAGWDDAAIAERYEPTSDEFLPEDDSDINENTDISSGTSD